MSVNWSPPFWLWGYFIPVGLLLLNWGSLPPRKARQVTSLAGFALTISALCYWAVGFAFHMGGAQVIQPDNAALQGLDRLYTLVPDQPGWGVVGLAGFFLTGDAIGPEVYGFFLAYLPILTTSVLLISLVLVQLQRWLAVLVSFVVATIVVPVALCWVWGSGWLANLGTTMGFGYGYVDFGGGSLIVWLPSVMLLGVLFFQRPDARLQHEEEAPREAYEPLVAHLGALLMGIGWMGWTLSNPFHIISANLHWGRTALNMVLGMAGAALTSQLYAWLILGTPQALIAARGLAAGWVTLIIAAPFLSPWLALLLGMISGAIFPFIHYAVETRAKLRIAAATLSIGLTSGPLGVLGVAVFANGRWGQGWNNVNRIAGGSGLNLSQNSQGIAGIFASRDMAQLKAQVVGLAALGLWGVVFGGVVGIVARVLSPQKYSGLDSDLAAGGTSLSEPVVPEAENGIFKTGRALVNSSADLEFLQDTSSTAAHAVDEMPEIGEQDHNENES